MGDPESSSYLSALGIKVYNLTGVGLNLGKGTYMYVRCLNFLGVACNKSPIVPNTTPYLKSDYGVGLQSHESTYQD